MTVIHPKPINQSPMVLLLHAANLIEDAMYGNIDMVGNDKEIEAWYNEASAWLRNHGAYINREFGDDNV